MLHPIKHYNDFSISAERIKQYQAMPPEKRLEWLYLGNLLRKAFCEMIEKEPSDANKHHAGNSTGSRG